MAFNKKLYFQAGNVIMMVLKRYGELSRPRRSEVKQILLILS